MTEKLGPGLVRMIEKALRLGARGVAESAHWLNSPPRKLKRYRRRLQGHLRGMDRCARQMLGMFPQVEQVNSLAQGLQAQLAGQVFPSLTQALTSSQDLKASLDAAHSRRDPDGRITAWDYDQVSRMAARQRACVGRMYQEAAQLNRQQPPYREAWQAILRFDAGVKGEIRRLEAMDGQNEMYWREVNRLLDGYAITPQEAGDLARLNGEIEQLQEQRHAAVQRLNDMLRLWDSAIEQVGGRVDAVNEGVDRLNAAIKKMNQSMQSIAGLKLCSVDDRTLDLLIEPGQE